MSKVKRMMDALGGVDEKFIMEAAPANTVKKKKPVWMKWGAMAACFAVAAALGAGFLQGRCRTDTAALNNGDQLVFEQADTLGGSFALAFEVTAKPLTADEAEAIFGDLPITANAVFKAGDMDAGLPQELLGFEGQLGKVKAVLSTSDVPLLDTVIAGTEETSRVNGVSIAAGYFITAPNSKGEESAIYYAAFQLGSCKVYLENAGAKENRETTKNQLAEAVQRLIDNGAPDLTSLGDEMGAGLDGNPDGYDRLPNNQPSDEEVPEQDPAAN